MSSKIVVGQTTFRDTVMDYNPIFRVVEKKAGGVYRCVSEDDDGYGGVERFFSAAQIKSKVQWESTIDSLFNRSDDFWSTVELGRTLHYHNGFGEFVRGVVVIHDGKRQFKPTALVGKWSERDLPRRGSDGEIYYPYHAKRVVFGGEDAPWRPNDGCVWEAPGFARQGQLDDPTTMEPIDLSVPEPTPEEAAEQAKERLIKQIAEVISTRYETRLTPDETFSKIRELLPN